MEYKYSTALDAFYPVDMLDAYTDLPIDLMDVSEQAYDAVLHARSQGLAYRIADDGASVSVAPSSTHDWDVKANKWVLDKAKQAELDKQVIDAADAQLTCLMSQMCAWLTIESYKPKADQRGGNILSPIKIDEMLRGLPDSVETDLMRNAWSRATYIEFTSETTQSFAQILGVSKEQLRVAMTEARGL